uniref:Chromosome 17 open reading frame 75 n=1 Tax=Fundulus heteroclitus TaxID=8078 RepID=A0A3Q2Q8V6_FUNHE
MFSSQTSSFQDSIDVEEKDEFDSEDIAGYSQKTQLNCYYTIYLYQATALDRSIFNGKTFFSSHNNFSLCSSDKNLIVEIEVFDSLCFLCSLPEQAVGCYCCLLEQERSPEQPDADGNGYVICFMGGSEKELDKYVQGLQSSLQTPEVRRLRPYLSRWYEESVMHIHRVVQLVQSNISFLLHAALSHTHVEVINADERTKADVSRFIKAASLQGLSQQDTTTASLCKAMSEDTQSDLTVDCSTSPPTLTNTGGWRSCNMTFLLYWFFFSGNPFKIIQFPSQLRTPLCWSAIHDMNSLKRFVRQAEMSHYALFRCCQFLRGCGNGDVLLQNARAEHSDLPEACNIIAVLDEFLSEQAEA